MALPTDPVFWLLAIASITFLGLAKGGFTGVGVVATPLLALVLPPLQTASGPVWGAISGFTSTFAHAGGSPYQVYMLPQRLPKMTYAGTTTMFFAAVNYLKAGPYFMLGQFTPENLKLSLALIPLAIFTNFAGIWLLRRTPQEIFYRIVYILTLLVCLELIRNGATAMLGW